MNSQIRLREILEDSCPQCDRGTVLDGYDNASCGEMIHNEAFLDQAEKALVDYFIELLPLKGVIASADESLLTGIDFNAAKEIHAEIHFNKGYNKAIDDMKAKLGGQE